MATTFPNFPILPWELRNEIWKNHLPSETPALAGELASHILGLTQQDDFWRGYSRARRHQPKIRHTWRPRPRPQVQQKSTIQELQQETTSPYQALAGCAESRILALKQVKKELENDPRLSKWLKNPPFPFRPKLVLDKTNGALIYTCPQIVEQYHLENIVFKEPPAETLTKTTPASTLRPLTQEDSVHQFRQVDQQEEEEEADWDPENPIYYAEKEADAMWSDHEDEKEEKVTGLKRSREGEEVEKMQKRQKKSQDAVDRDD